MIQVRFELTLEWQHQFDDPFMPYKKLTAATLDLTEFKKDSYIDFFNEGARGILKQCPLDVAKKWAQENLSR